jgi:hypothetical protein
MLKRWKLYFKESSFLWGSEVVLNMAFFLVVGFMGICENGFVVFLLGF